MKYDCSESLSGTSVLVFETIAGAGRERVEKTNTDVPELNAIFRRISKSDLHRSLSKDKPFNHSTFEIIYYPTFFKGFIK